MPMSQELLFLLSKKTVPILVFGSISSLSSKLPLADEDREIILSYPDCIKYVSSLLAESTQTKELAPASFKLIAELAKNETIRLQLSIHSVISPICAYIQSTEKISNESQDGIQQAFRALGNLCFDNGMQGLISKPPWLILGRYG